MIKLTLLNDTEILININSIDKIDDEEPTSIILIGGKAIEIKETPLTVMNMIKAYSLKNEMS